jgi:hypothetical protein
MNPETKNLRAVANMCREWAKHPGYYDCENELRDAFKRVATTLDEITKRPNEPARVRNRVIQKFRNAD